MKGFLAFALLLSTVACGTDLDVGTGSGTVDRGDDFAVIPGGNGDEDGDSDEDGSDEDGIGGDANDPVQPEPEDPTTPVDVDEPASGTAGSSPPPSETSQSCTIWQDCGPNFGDLNSGFDCDSGQCVCNVASDHDDDCAAIGGLWSEQECFCFVTSSRPPQAANDDIAYDDRDDRAPYCWWRYRKECDRDRWVDTSYYERVCTQGQCRDVWRSRGYWTQGRCTDVWTRRCDDGSQTVYRY